MQCFFLKIQSKRELKFRERQNPLWPACLGAIISRTNYYSRFNSLKMNSLVVLYQWKKSIKSGCAEKQSRASFPSHLWPEQIGGMHWKPQGQAWVQRNIFPHYAEPALPFRFLMQLIFICNLFFPCMFLLQPAAATSVPGMSNQAPKNTRVVGAGRFNWILNNI